MKLYRTRTHEQYDWLMQKLEDEGCFWGITRENPTVYNYFDKHGSETVISVDEIDDTMGYDNIEFQTTEYPNEPIIEVSDLMGNKFKVGDEVRIIKNAGGTITDRRGEVHTVVRVNPKGLYPYELSNTLLYPEDCLEPITDHDYLMDKILERNNKPEKLNTGDPWIDNLPESYFEMYEVESLKEPTESLDLINQHKRICERLNKVYADKNHDYGNSFGATYEKYGDISALVRISDKMNRIEQLVQTGEQKVKDEALEDSILDMANYLIMWAMELEEEE